jgi:predicted nucleic acid-binding Zn ribbon protein
MKHKHCEWCDTQFQTKVSYQIYCSPNCREQATKEKIAQRYAQTRRSKRLSKVRNCKSCSAPLSAYNDEDLCYECLVNPVEVKKALKELKGFTNGKS